MFERRLLSLAGRERRGVGLRDGVVVVGGGGGEEHFKWRSLIDGHFLVRVCLFALSLEVLGDFFAFSFLLFLYLLSIFHSFFHVCLFVYLFIYLFVYLCSYLFV